MPRRRTIYARRINLRRWQIDIEAIASSSRGVRRDHFSQIADRLDQADDIKIAVVRIEVQPRRRGRVPAYGPQRSALVIFPFDESLNQGFKGLGLAKAEFDGKALGWVLSINTEVAAEALVRWLLKDFDILVVADGSLGAIVHH